MVQIIPADNRWSGLGEALGSAIGQTLGGKLRNHRLQQVLENVETYRTSHQNDQNRDPFAEENYVRQQFGSQFEPEGEKYLERLGQLRNQQYVNSLFGGEQQGGQQQMNGQQQPGQSQMNQYGQPQQQMQGQQQLRPLSYRDKISDATAKISDAQLQALGNIDEKAYKRIVGIREKNFDKNEPALREMGNELDSLKDVDAKLGSLQRINDKVGALPNNVVAGLFTSDGNLNDTYAAANLSPEAHQFVKLTNELVTSVAKSRLGGQFAASELKLVKDSFPSLIQSPEGRREILNTMRLVNEASQLRAQSIQDVFKDLGGVDRIPLSQAQSLVDNELKSKLDDIRGRIVQGLGGQSNQKTYDNLTDALKTSRSGLIHDTEKGEYYMRTEKGGPKKVSKEVFEEATKDWRARNK